MKTKQRLERLKDFIERKAFKLIEEQGVCQNDLKNQVLEDLRILENSFYNYEQLTILMAKYGIKTIEELEHIILNDATGEQAFKDYCGTTGRQHLNCEKLGLIKTDSGYGLVNTDLFPYDKESNEECKENLISSNIVKDLEILGIIKKKRVNLDGIMLSNNKWYLKFFQSNDCDALTETEFNLIKEWLENE